MKKQYIQPTVHTYRVDLTSVLCLSDTATILTDSDGDADIDGDDIILQSTSYRTTLWGKDE